MTFKENFDKIHLISLNKDECDFFQAFKFDLVFLSI